MIESVYHKVLGLKKDSITDHFLSFLGNFSKQLFVEQFLASTFVLFIFVLDFINLLVVALFLQLYFNSWPYGAQVSNYLALLNK